jgi:hypothetical protein
MGIFVERKYLIAIGILLAGFSVGLFVLWRQNGAGILGADLSRALGGGEWVEIKPRTASSTIESVVASQDENGKNAAIEKPKPVVWCEIKAGVAAEKERQIIFNEIAWMGGQNSYSDEWIELKNITDQEINLAGWQLQNKNQKIKIVFDENDILPAGGLYLLERTDDDSAPSVAANRIYKGSLGNANEALYLFDLNCRLRDIAGGAAKWPAGDNAAKKTMIRLPSFGWATSIVIGGTPGAENK